MRSTSCSLTNSPISTPFPAVDCHIATFYYIGAPGAMIKKSMKHIFSLGLIAGAALAQTPPPTSMPGLKLGLDELKAQYAAVGAGKRLKPKKWPNGARIAVALSFDVDNATVPLSRGD